MSRRQEILSKVYTWLFSLYWSSS